MHIRLFILSFAVLLLGGCQKDSKEQIKSLVKKWDNREILFPENPIFTRFIDDTVSYKIPQSNYKIVSFVDSIGCMSCKLQLSKWKEFIHKVDSLSDGNVPFIFFFQAKDIRELQYILKRDNFSYPVCIDVKDKFNSLNYFPSQMMFQTFLVDSNNHIKIIGNPIHSLSVRELYFQELSGMTMKTQLTTVLQTDASEYHWGTINKGETKNQTVVLKNVGKEIFRMKGVTTSCDCIEVKYDWSEIKPGKKDVMTITYNAEEAGAFWRNITIYGNIPQKCITLDFWGTIK